MTEPLLQRPAPGKFAIRAKSLLITIVLAFSVMSHPAHGANLATVTLTASTAGAGFLGFETNPGGTFGSGTTFVYGNQDPLNPARTVWKAYITGPNAGEGVFILLNGLDVTSAPNQQLVFEVRGSGNNEQFTVKLESNNSTCNAEIPRSALFTITTNYQEVRIPLGQFTSPCAIDRTRMHAWTIVSTQSSDITVYFDSLRFE